jgi:hypothetical protein
MRKTSSHKQNTPLAPRRYQAKIVCVALSVQHNTHVHCVVIGALSLQQNGAKKERKLKGMSRACVPSSALAFCLELFKLGLKSTSSDSSSVSSARKVPISSMVSIRSDGDDGRIGVRIYYWRGAPRAPPRRLILSPPHRLQRAPPSNSRKKTHTTAADC